VTSLKEREESLTDRQRAHRKRISRNGNDLESAVAAARYRSLNVNKFYSLGYATCPIPDAAAADVVVLLEEIDRLNKLLQDK